MLKLLLCECSMKFGWRENSFRSMGNYFHRVVNCKSCAIFFTTYRPLASWMLGYIFSIRLNATFFCHRISCVIVFEYSTLFMSIILESFITARCFYLLLSGYNSSQSVMHSASIWQCVYAGPMFLKEICEKLCSWPSNKAVLLWFYTKLCMWI